MGVEPESADPDAVLPGRALSRRSLIRGAAAAGVTGWVAPVVLDSLVSPAAAGTITPSLFGSSIKSDSKDDGSLTSKDTGEVAGVPAGTLVLIFSAIADKATTVTATPSDANGNLNSFTAITSISPYGTSALDATVNFRMWAWWTTVKTAGKTKVKVTWAPTPTNTVYNGTAGMLLVSNANTASPIPGSNIVTNSGTSATNPNYTLSPRKGQSNSATVVFGDDMMNKASTSKNDPAPSWPSSIGSLSLAISDQKNQRDGKTQNYVHESAVFFGSFVQSGSAILTAATSWGVIAFEIDNA